MTEKRFVSEDDCCGYYTEIIDNEKELDLSLPNPKKNLTIEELVDLLNAFYNENEQLKIKLIYNFIKNNIIPKYDVLCSCKVQDNEFYIEYDEFLSFDERNILNREILQQIYDFCVSSDIEEDCFFNISVFLVINK